MGIVRSPELLMLQAFLARTQCRDTASSHLGGLTYLVSENGNLTLRTPVLIAFVVCKTDANKRKEIL